MTAEPILSTRPVYLQIRDILALRITNGKWSPGQAITGEQDLASQFKVSVATVRKALGELEADGLIERRQGRGTFVTDRLSETHQAKYDRVRRPDGSRFDWIFLHEKVTSGQATREQARCLEIDEGDEVALVRRLRRGDANIYLLEDAAVPASIFKGLADRTDCLRGIVTLCHAYGVVPGSYVQTLQNVPASEEFAALAKIDAGAIVWKLVRTTRDFDGHAIEYREAIVTAKGCVYWHDS